jgi:type IV pilus assembly protein PilV
LRVSVAWQCLTETRAPALPCGEDGYGNEAKRRVLAIRVTLADLN